MYGRWEIAPNKLDGPENQSPAAPRLKVIGKNSNFQNIWSIFCMLKLATSIPISGGEKLFNCLFIIKYVVKHKSAKLL